MDWNSFCMGIALGEVLVLLPCMWIIRKEHYEVISLLDRSIAITEKWRERYKALKGGE